MKYPFVVALTHYHTSHLSVSPLPLYLLYLSQCFFYLGSVVNFRLTNARTSPIPPSFLFFLLFGYPSLIVFEFLGLKISIILLNHLIGGVKCLLMYLYCLCQIQINPLWLIFFFQLIDINTLHQLLIFNQSIL